MNEVKSSKIERQGHMDRDQRGYRRDAWSSAQKMIGRLRGADRAYGDLRGQERHASP